MVRILTQVILFGCASAFEMYKTVENIKGGCFVYTKIKAEIDYFLGTKSSKK